mmetsp:Transcript_13928/g.33765  ORF Transcript_13928/g.33765 Transcript_13928/m.33765 type:complete len:557 (+) Transcript_13928:246-1916(+)
MAVMTQRGLAGSGEEVELLDGERDTEAGNASELKKRDASPVPTAAPLSGFRVVPVAVAVVLFLLIINAPGELKMDGVEVPAAKKCLAIVVFVSALWATEAIPLYVTSLLVPLLSVACGALLPPPPTVPCAALDSECIRAQFVPYKPPQAAKEICAQFFDPTVLLFMAGFSIGAVLEKQRISNMIASVLLKPFGNKPEHVMLGIMSLGMFLSMWISNVPSSVLCVSLAQPLVNQLPAKDPFAKALLLGIAISNNIGGMTTPIASPQNVIAFNWCGLVGSPVTFPTWLLFTVPYCSILLLISWVILRIRYPPMLRALQISELLREQSRMNPSQILATVTTVSTVLAWAFWKPLNLEDTFGSMGLVGLFPICIFFSSGLLDRNDFHNALNWSVLILIGGGLALGHVMERSYLLQIMSSAIQESLSGAGFWVYMMAFAMLMALAANFISSTVAAIIILPVVAKVGKSIGHGSGMIIGAVIMDSAAMALPVSSFPNANSFSVVRKGAPAPSEDEGDVKARSGSVLEVQDYIITGGSITLCALALLATVGFALIPLVDQQQL